jgi:hypothetical protein
MDGQHHGGDRLSDRSRNYSPRHGARHRRAPFAIALGTVPLATGIVLGALASSGPGSPSVPAKAGHQRPLSWHQREIASARLHIKRYGPVQATHTSKAIAASQPPSVASSVPAGFLGCSQLEALWVQAGGPASAEHTAADIAVMESYAGPGLSNPGATGAAGEEGPWQINPVNDGLVISGYTIEATYDPLGNARDAVALSHGGADWSAWTTYTSGAYLSAGC